MAVKQNLKSKMAQIGLCLFIALFGSNLLIADTKLLNEFTSGTPAKASEVNENFTVLNSKIESITNPEKSYSIISSEILESGLVRTKLYAYEQYSSSRHVTWHDTVNITPESAVESTGLGVVINALGQFQIDWFYRNKFLQAYSNSKEAEFAHVTCPDGSQIVRQETDIAFNLNFMSLAGSFVLSNRGGINTGAFKGYCDGAVNPPIFYYYAEGFGSGVYSCVSRVAYYGSSDGGGFTNKTAPLDRTGYDPYAMITTFDRTSNSEWLSYQLEIDAPAGCITLSGPAPVEPTPTPAPVEPTPTPAPVTPDADNTTSDTTSE